MLSLPAASVTSASWVRLYNSSGTLDEARSDGVLWTMVAVFCNENFERVIFRFCNNILNFFNISCCCKVNFTLLSFVYFVVVKFR